MEIPFIDVAYENKIIRNEIIDMIENLIPTGDYIKGERVTSFEEEIAKYCGVNYAIGVNSGTDALIIAMKALGIGQGDEVITSSNSFIATLAAIVWIGAKPVMVDIDDTYNIDADQIEEKINARTKAILPVHFTGRLANMNKIMELGKKYKIPVIEDAAQAMGASIAGKKAGSFGDLGCFSFFPTKNLSGIGDGGLIVTNNPELYTKIKLMTDFGRKNRDLVVLNGINSRLDELQAGILGIKLKYYPDWLNRRLEIAEMYHNRLSYYFDVPTSKAQEKQVYHLYIAKLKNPRIDNISLQKRLEKRQIDVRIHYPVPMHLQSGYEFLGYKKGDFPMCEELSKQSITLPIHTSLHKEQVNRIIVSICKELEE
jgi:UDP-2-acetamido-2-deoxy-ribo-hexuluronate aminotransferase